MGWYWKQTLLAWLAICAVERRLTAQVTEATAPPWNQTPLTNSAATSPLGAAAASGPAGPAWTNTPAAPPTSPPPFITNRAGLKFPVMIDQPPVQPTKVWFFVSRDRGAQWKPVDTKVLAPNQPAEERDFVVQNLVDGEYWFLIRSAEQLATAIPQPHEPPQKIVIVDTQRPQLQLDFEPVGVDQVRITWWASDPYLVAESVQLERQDGQGAWQPVPTQAEPGVASGTLRGATGPIAKQELTGFVRMSVQDRAGNMATATRSLTAVAAGGLTAPAAPSGAAEPRPGDAAPRPAGLPFVPPEALLDSALSAPGTARPQTASSNPASAGGPSNDPSADFPLPPDEFSPAPAATPPAATPPTATPPATTSAPATSAPATSAPATPPGAMPPAATSNAAMPPAAAAPAGAPPAAAPPTTNSLTTAPPPFPAPSAAGPAESRAAGVPESSASPSAPAALPPAPPAPWSQAPNLPALDWHSGPAAAGSNAANSGTSGSGPSPTRSTSVSDSTSSLSPPSSGSSLAWPAERPGPASPAPGTGQSASAAPPAATQGGTPAASPANPLTAAPPAAQLSFRPTSVPVDYRQLPGGSVSREQLQHEHAWSVQAQEFELDYDLENVGSGGLGRVDLYESRDGGATWEYRDADLDRVSPMRVQVTEDGIYGYRLHAVSPSGLAGPKPLPGDKPDVWVCVDTQSPRGELTSIQFEQQPVPRLVISWTTSDLWLAERPITLEYRSPESTQWQTVAAGLPDSGHYVWNLDERVPPQVLIRLVVTDRAGNTHAAQAPHAVTTHAKAPAIKVRNLRAAGQKEN